MVQPGKQEEAFHVLHQLQGVRLPPLGSDCGLCLCHRGGGWATQDVWIADQRAPGHSRAAVFCHHSRCEALWRHILVFLVLCLGISNVMENLGVMTGFPFGPYHYTDVLGPKLFLVPLLIGPAYFGTGYVSWVLANVLLETDRRRDPLATFVGPVVATFIMVGWDVCLDPGSSTVLKLWIWEKGGGYFGVPLTNYLGWCLTVFLFLQTFALYRAYRPEPLVAPPPRSHWLQASVFFAVMAMDFLALHYATQSVAVTDA